MWRSPSIAYLVGRVTRHEVARIRTPRSWFSSTVQVPTSNWGSPKAVKSAEDLHGHQASSQHLADDVDDIRKKYQIGENVSRKDKIEFLLRTLLDIEDNKEAIYGALDAWVAWEQMFPIASIKRTLLLLEKEQQWHRVVQVIKWMLSKGQGNTMGTYGQLIRALDMDHRAEEAHKFWTRKIGMDLHSAPWQLCRQMISIYYRNDMMRNIVELFKRLEAFDRKPPEKSIVKRVADAYEILGLVDEKNKLLEKYNYLFIEKPKRSSRKLTGTSNRKLKKSGPKNQLSTSESHPISTDDTQTS